MNKNRYQQIMNRIQMPERCEQAILEQLHTTPAPFQLAELGNAT